LFSRPSPAAEIGQVHILDPRARERLRERLAREMRIAPRARITPDVGQPGDTVLAEQPDQLVKGTRGMADGEDAHTASGERRAGEKMVVPPAARCSPLTRAAASTAL